MKILRPSKRLDLSTILCLHRCSEFIIRRYPNVKKLQKCRVKHWKRMIK